MFQEIDYLFLFSEKPADISRDRLFISFSRKTSRYFKREIIYFISPKNQLMFQEIDYLFHSRKTN
jgi:hypothetical protein